MLYVLICDQEARLVQLQGAIETDAKNLYAHFQKLCAEKSIPANTVMLLGTFQHMLQHQ